MYEYIEGRALVITSACQNKQQSGFTSRPIVSIHEGYTFKTICETRPLRNLLRIESAVALVQTLRTIVLKHV